MLKNIIALKTWTRKLGCAFAFFGLSLPLVNSAFAISAGCTAWNVTNPNNDGLLATNVAFSAWEVAKITFTHNSGASPNNYTYTYTDNNNAANSRSATAGSTTTGETVTLTIQIPADTTDGRLFWNASGTTALYSFTGNCVAAPQQPLSALSRDPKPRLFNGTSRRASHRQSVLTTIPARITYNALPLQCAKPAPIVPA